MKALIAMSGGVDSSVAAKLIIDRGFECIGCTMKLHSERDNDTFLQENSCCSSKDIEDARSVCERLSIPYSVSNFSEDFKEKIIDRFIASYERGVTPNPCIECNRHMKFEKLYQRGKELGCDYIVTGHYVRIREENGEYFLLKAADETKDQSYVLYSMSQEQLKRTLFPLGELKKSEVREIAEKNGFVNAHKPDSQDICFVPDGDYAHLIEETTGRKPKPGNFISPDGTVLGKHRGIIHYTIGQRRGIGLSFPEPRYIADIDAKRNTVTIGKQEDLFSSLLQASSFHWISGKEPTAPIRCSAKIRYLHKEQPCTVTPMKNGRVMVVFDDPQRAITPGQAVVLYDGEIVLGGGTIEPKANWL